MKRIFQAHRRTVRAYTILVDLIIFNAGFMLAYVARYRWQWIAEVEPQNFVAYREYIGQQGLLNLLLIIGFFQIGVWKRRRGEFWVDEMARIGYAIAAAFIIMMAYTFFFRPLAVSRLMLFQAALFIAVLIGIARSVRRGLLALAYRRGLGVDPVLIIGAGEAGRGVIRTLLARPDLGFQAIGYLDDGDEAQQIGSARIPCLGRVQTLRKTLKKHPELHTVFIALPADRHREILRMANLCRREGVYPRVVPDLLQLSLNQVELNNMAGIPILSVREIHISKTGQILKRLIDLLLLLILAVPSLIVSAIIAIAIKRSSPGPVLFFQNRVGQGDKPFKMIKFRSMVVDAEAQRDSLQALNEVDGPIFKIKDDPRLTGVGRIIRRLSLDELPQFYNILKGEMSFVGPRPPLPDEVAQYSDWHRQRLEVKGGLTGLWQVSGRSDLTFDEQCLLDIYYIEHWSPALDIRIILQTVPFTLFGRGAY